MGNKCGNTSTLVNPQIGDYVQFSAQRREERVAKEMRMFRPTWMNHNPVDKQIYKITFVNSYEHRDHTVIEYTLESISEFGKFYSFKEIYMEDYVNLGQNLTAIEVLYGEQLPKGKNDTY